MHCFHKSLLHLLVVKQSNKDQKMKHERSSAIETCSIQCVSKKCFSRPGRAIKASM